MRLSFTAGLLALSGAAHAVSTLGTWFKIPHMSNILYTQN